MMTAVFISHADVDKVITAEICDALNREGVPTWVSFRDIRPGENWEASIESALTSARCVIVIVSPRSVESSYVRAEVEEAIRQYKTVIPIVVQPVLELPLRWRMLQNVKWSVNKKKPPSAKFFPVFRTLQQQISVKRLMILHDLTQFVV